MHENYDHYNPEMIKKLDGFWGKVDKKIIDSIYKHVTGSKVLDIGCGFGSLTDRFREKGLKSVGSDILPISIEQANLRFPLSKFVLVTDERQPFANNEFDTVVIRDVIHHVIDEGNIELFCSEVNRIVNKRVIICDPNPTIILKTARFLLNHKDPICTPVQSMDAFKDYFNVVKLDYNIMFSLPISGGYISKNLVPKYFEDFTLKIETYLEIVAQKLKLIKFVSWRYYLVLEKK